jgi:hypothetical protein
MWLAGWDEGSEQFPLRIVEITGIDWECHAGDALRKVLETRVSGRVSSGWLLLASPFSNT